MTVSQYISKFLKKQRVSTVFGHTGESVLPLYEQVKNVGIDYIINANELNSSYMADGYARVSQMPGILIATTGPGITNMTTGIANAYADSVPLFIICAITPNYLVGKNAHQEGSGIGNTINQVNLFRNCSKGSFLISHIDEIISTFVRAWELMLSGRNGPVIIHIRADLFTKLLPERHQPLNKLNIEQRKSVNVFNRLTIDRIFKKIYSAKHPFLILGEGLDIRSNKQKIQLKIMLNQLGIPYAVSPLAKSFVNERSPLCIGSMRGRGSSQVFEYIQNSDLIVLLGDRLKHLEIGPKRNLFKSKKLIQIDCDGEQINKVYKSNIFLNGNFLDYIKNRNIQGHQRKSEFINEISHLSEKIIPNKITKIMEDCLIDNEIIVADSGYTKSLMIAKYKTTFGQQFVCADNFSPMGYSIPAAIGASLATKKTVVCVVGDGSFMMTFNEMLFFLKTHKKLIFILLNNGGLASIKDLFFDKKQKLSVYPNPDYKAMMRIFAVKYHLASLNNLKKELGRALKDNNPSFIELNFNQRDIVW